MRFRGQIAALICFGTACCTAPAPEPTPAPPARPASTPAPTVEVPSPSFDNWMDAPQTPGDWFYRRSGTTTVALFGTAGTDARFALTCKLSGRTITLARAGTASGAVPMRIRTETADRVLSAQPSGGELPSIIASVAATDPILDAMAFSKGRFAVETAGQSTLYLPSWPEVTRVIEDCRG